MANGGARASFGPKKSDQATHLAQDFEVALKTLECVGYGLFGGRVILCKPVLLQKPKNHRTCVFCVIAGHGEGI